MLKDNLRKLRIESGKTQDDIANYLNLRRPSYTKYESGTSKPDADTIALLADLYNVSVDYLLGRDFNDEYSFIEKRLVHSFRKASDYAKKVAIFTLDNSYGSDQADTVLTCALYSTDYYPDYPVSAGTGNFMQDTQKETLILKKEPPAGAAYVICISGDSMEDEYHNGDKIFISPAPAQMGEVGIFLYENEAYIKKLGDHELISLNPKYAPIKIKNPDNFFCIGTVVGKCGKDYFA